MRRLGRMLGWTALALAALVAVAAAGLAAFARTDRFRSMLREHAVTYLNRTLRGQVSVGAIEGSIFGRLVLRDVALDYAGAEVARIAELELDYALWPMLRRRANRRHSARAPEPGRHRGPRREGRVDAARRCSRRPPRGRRRRGNPR